MALIVRMLAWVALLAGLSSSAAAGQEHLAAIERECSRQPRMAAESCRCLRDQAAKLKEGQQAFVAALVLKDKQAQAMAQQKLSIQEVAEAVSFLTAASSQCSGR